MSQPFTLPGFNQLPDTEKFALLETEGIHLLNRLEGSYTVALFSLYDYYVEVWLHNSTNEIRQTSGFQNTDHLEPFLATIDLTCVYSLL